MGCKDCELANQSDRAEYPYRWGTANIRIIGCRKHVREVMAALTHVQGHYPAPPVTMGGPFD